MKKGQQTENEQYKVIYDIINNYLYIQNYNLDKYT